MRFDDLKSFARSWALETSDDCIDHSNADRMNRIDPQLSTVPFTPFAVNRIVEEFCVVRRQKFLDCWLLTKRLRAMAATDIQKMNFELQSNFNGIRVRGFILTGAPSSI
jgi:hypothetical protein